MVYQQVLYLLQFQFKSHQVNSRFSRLQVFLILFKTEFFLKCLVCGDIFISKIFSFILVKPLSQDFLCNFLSALSDFTASLLVVLFSLCTPAEPRTEELGGNDPETKVVEVETELTCGNKAGVAKGKEGDFALAFNSLAHLTNEPRETARA